MRRLIPALALAITGLASAAARAQDELPDVEGLDSLSRMISISGVLTSIVVIGIAYLMLRFLRVTVESVGERFATQRLLLQKVATGLQFAIYVGTGVIVFMLSFNLNDQVLALVGGTIAVSVGFSIKDLVASFIAGIMILIDRPFQVGDRVSFGGEYGDITKIGLRSVRLQTLDDNTVTIPNNKFLSEITSSGNYGALDMQVVVDFFVGVDQDIELAQRLVHEAAITGRYIYLPKPVVVLVNQVIEDSYVSVRLRMKGYVLDIRYEKAFETDITLRVLAAFRDHGILPPAILHRPAPVGPAPVPSERLAVLKDAQPS